MNSAAQSVLTLSPEQVAQHPDNLRDASRDIDALAASIKEVGVLVPLIVVPVDAIAGDWADGVTHVAVDGNRRQLAAAQVGVDLPCIVRDDLISARDTALTMTVTGLARDGWTQAEEIHGVQALLDLGLSQAAVSRASGRKPAHVRAAKKAASLSPETAESAIAYDLTLDQMATLAEYDGDDEAVCLLLDAAQHGRMAHAVAQITRQRKADKDLADTIAALTDQKITVTDESPAYGGNGRPYLLAAIKTPDGEFIDPEQHQSCPGHAVAVSVTWDGEVEQIPCCTLDLATSGHVARYASASHSPTPTGGPMTDEQKAERRDLIARNKEMVAAQDVRRAFVRGLISGRKHTKTAAAWALARIATREHTLIWRLHDHTVDPILAELLGEQHSPARVLRGAPAARHPMLLWAAVAATYESVMPKDVWRRSLSSRKSETEYLAHLVDLGYVPCDTETRMIADLTSDDGQDDEAADLYDDLDGDDHSEEPTD